MTVSFHLAGQEFTALNGGPDHPFTDAVSFQVECGSQEEVDRIWAALTDGGEEVMCGWLKDRFGVSWQIVPRVLGELMSSTDRAAAKRAADAMMKMVKLDGGALQAAFDGR